MGRSTAKPTRKAIQDDSSFWKQCAREYMAKYLAQKEKEQMPEKHEDM